MMMDAMPAIDDEQITPTLSIVQNYMIKNSYTENKT